MSISPSFGLCNDCFLNCRLAASVFMESQSFHALSWLDASSHQESEFGPLLGHLFIFVIGGTKCCVKMIYIPIYYIAF